MPKSSTVDKGKGKEPDASKKKMKFVPSMRSRELLLALLLPLQHPRWTGRRGSDLEATITTSCLRVPKVELTEKRRLL